LGAPASIITTTLENGMVIEHTHLSGSLAPDRKVSQSIFIDKENKQWIVNGATI
jgi:hypothetical protein